MSPTDSLAPPPHRRAHRPASLLQVLTYDQEQLALGLVVEMAMQRKPISPSELMRRAGETARANGSRLNPTDLRSWFAGFNAQVLKKYSINLETVQPPTAPGS